MTTRFLPLLGLIVLFALTACSKDEPASNQNPSLSDDIRELQVPPAFNFETASELQTRIQVQGLQGQALNGVKVSFYTDHPDFGGEQIGVGLTKTNGLLEMPLRVPAFLSQIFVRVHQAGFSNIDSVPVQPLIDLSFGGVNPQRKMKMGAQSATPIPISGNYYYMGTYNSGTYKGLPHYLENPGDNISQAFLNDVDASLPEERPVPTYNPQYLTSGNELDVVITQRSDVWVTFVAEGAGYRNALGYYVFDSNNPPSDASQIDSIFIIFPNTSFAYSGGELYSGDKVNLGTFDAGKTISWVLFQNAWTGSGVNVNKNKFYSNSAFNTNESDPNKRQHTVALSDIGRQLVLIGYEDQTRSAGSDNDFNDLVMDYDIDHVLNANNEVLNIDADWTIKAVGASFKNGFGFELDGILPSEITSITGYDLQENYISLNANGTESGQTAATAIVFDNVYNLISTNGGAFINTEAGQTPVTPVTLNMAITFVNPTAQSSVGIPPYDPFLIVNGVRGREIHLAGEDPTDLADATLFNTLSDATDGNSNYYYKTANGLPWAIDVTTPFSYPIETAPIDDAYLNFSQWAVSGGSAKTDWAQDVQGYRNTAKIF